MIREIFLIKGQDPRESKGVLFLLLKSSKFNVPWCFTSHSCIVSSKRCRYYCQRARYNSHARIPRPGAGRQYFPISAHSSSPTRGCQKWLQMQNGQTPKSCHSVYVASTLNNLVVIKRTGLFWHSGLISHRKEKEKKSNLREQSMVLVWLDMRLVGFMLH